MTMMVVTPGPDLSARTRPTRTAWRPIRTPSPGSTRSITRKAWSPMTRGRLTLPALIPGATYRIYDNTMGEDAAPRLRKEFTVKPGETLDLGDILIEKVGRAFQHRLRPGPSDPTDRARGWTSPTYDIIPDTAGY